MRGARLGRRRSPAALLGFLLLLVAATSRAAAIHGRDEPPRDHPNTQHLTPAHTLTNTAQETKGSGDYERSKEGAAQSSVSTALEGGRPVSKDNTRIITSCPLAEWSFPQEDFQDWLEEDNLQRYLPRPDTLPLESSEASPRFGQELPTGCQDMERFGPKALLCTGNNITQIPDLMLERNVESLEFRNTGIQAVRDVSRLPRSCRYLTFSNGPLVTFDGRSLYQIFDLEMLSLEYNTLNTWSFVSVFHSDHAPRNITLQTLNLQNNLITYPPQPTGQNVTVLPFLKQLIFNNNPMSNLPGNLFEPLRASNLTQLFLKNCSLTQFYGSPLEPVAGLEVLDLSYNTGLLSNKLAELLAPLLNGRLRDLFLTNNNYINVPTAALSMVNASLEQLDLHGSAFHCLDNSSFPWFPKLRKLNLMYSRISMIHANTFDVFPVLEELNLDGNGLITIPTEVLLPTLKILTLSGNPRSTGDQASATFNLDQVDFRNMGNLTNTTFQGVPLGHVTIDDFNDLHGLQDLTLTSCQLTFIQPFSFRNLTQLEYLHINNNQLEVLGNDTFAGLTALIHLDLSDNKIVFQTNFAFAMLPLKRTVDVTLSERPVRSGAPSSLSAVSLDTGKGERDVKLSQVSRYLPFKGLRALRSLDLSENEIRYLNPDQWSDLGSLVTLFLTNNNIEEWQSSVFSKTNLTVLLLPYNSLSLVTEGMMKDFRLPSLTKVDLSQNTFQCECSIKKFFDINTSIFTNFSSYKCSQEDKVLTFKEYASTAICRDGPPPTEEPPKSTNLMAIIVSTSVLFSIIITSATLYRKRWYLRYLVYRARMNSAHPKEDADHYTYDIFVCYSQADRQWVFEHLVARLEDGGRYRVCVHERDFTVGQEITENIITSVDRSRKVVVVLSPAFVDSSWCMFELQVASDKILDERRNKLILVVLKPLPHHRQPQKLRLLLKSRTYLAWQPEPEGQRIFWMRLLRAVAKPSGSETRETITHM